MQSIGIGLVYFTRISFVSCIRMAHTPLNILHPLNQTSVFHSCILNQTKPILLFFISYRKPCSGRADHYSFQRRCPTLVHTRGRRPVTPTRAHMEKSKVQVDDVKAEMKAQVDDVKAQVDDVKAQVAG